MFGIDDGSDYDWMTAHFPQLMLAACVIGAVLGIVAAVLL